MMYRLWVIVVLLVSLASAGPAAVNFPWLDVRNPGQTEKVADIEPLGGYERVAVDSGGYAEWLRTLPLKRAGCSLKYYDGRNCPLQSDHYRIIDIDVGDRDLQQCADAVIRLRAEYLYSRKELETIKFNFTSGDRASFCRWALGYRPQVRGNDVSWLKQAQPDSSYQSFRDYLHSVFTYAGTYSLENEMVSVPNVADIMPGDVFIQGGFPGHVLMVVDVTRHKQTDQLAVLLAQGFTPAQDVHILKNIHDSRHSPWFQVSDSALFQTRFYSFETSDLKRFDSN